MSDTAEIAARRAILQIWMSALLTEPAVAVGAGLAAETLRNFAGIEPAAGSEKAPGRKKVRKVARMKTIMTTDL